MKTIKNSKKITTLELGDKVVFGDLEYEVRHRDGYFLNLPNYKNDKIFIDLNISKRDFVENLGIDTLPVDWSFPETKSLEALTAIVFALFREYEKQNELPKTWEEFCGRNPIKKGECFINNLSIIKIFNNDERRDADFTGDVCTSEQEAKAHLALMQLRQLRKAYVKNWEPDWTNDDEPKYCINLQANSFDVQCWYHMSNPFSFPTARLAKQFLDNFKDLLEIAKPLL